MTNEEAARILDPETSREALAEIEYYGGFCGMDAVIEASDEACRIAAEALRRGTSHASDEPLTLEQLRGMDGRPVWCKLLINGKSEWAIIRIVETSKTWFVALAGASQGFGDKDTYGKTWIAYAYPTAHIDREVWVSVKDRLPSEGQNVLVFATAKYAKGWKFAIDRLEEGEKNPIWIYTHRWFEVTHWMPLPEPPESRPPEGQS